MTRERWWRSFAGALALMCLVALASSCGGPQGAGVETPGGVAGGQAEEGGGASATAPTATLERELGGLKLSLTARAVERMGGYGVELDAVVWPLDLDGEGIVVSRWALFWTAARQDLDPNDENMGGGGAGRGRGGQSVGADDPVVRAGAPATLHDVFPGDDDDTDLVATPGSWLTVEYVFGPFAPVSELEDVGSGVGLFARGTSERLCVVGVRVEPDGTVSEVKIEPWTDDDD